MELKVGDRFIVGFSGPEEGNVIEIVDATPRRFKYKTIGKEQSRIEAFDADSSFAKSLKPVNNEYKFNKILITSDGTTTTARLYDGKKVTKTAEAKCNPSDKFDFVTGADLAYQRLVHPEPKPTYYNGKVVCVDNEGNEYIYTIGKVYTIKDGVFSADDGKLAFGQYKVKDFADFCEQTGSKFIEFRGEA